MRECYRLLSDDISCKEVFDELQPVEEVKDVRRLEPFLLCMESAFYGALSAHSIKKNEITEKTLEEHKKRYNEFEQITSFKNANSDLLNIRMTCIKEKCSPYSQSYVKNIIDYHTCVCDQKNSSKWLELEPSGKVQSFVQLDMSTNIDDWGRDYYLSSLYNIKKGIEKLS